MTEKREFQRYSCKIPSDFVFYDGNPNDFNIETANSTNGKGIIVDISRGGVFILTKSRVNINMPIELNFFIYPKNFCASPRPAGFWILISNIFSKKSKMNVKGTIVRTGLIKNNPSEVALRYAAKKIKGDAYIAIKFDAPLEELPK